jgi:hypothetical protein
VGCRIDDVGLSVRRENDPSHERVEDPEEPHGLQMARGTVFRPARLLGVDRVDRSR